MAEARPSDKSPDAFRTISEVADHLDLPQHVLRFWETKFSEIRPVKRAGGRRFYRPDDVDLLRAIRHLLYSEGYTIKGVQRILKDNGVRQVQGMGADLLEGLPVSPPAKAAPESAPAPEGARSGLLGLLPRRKERGAPAPVEDEDAFEEPSFEEPAFEAPLFEEKTRRTAPREPHFDAFLPGFDAPPEPAAPPIARPQADRAEPLLWDHDDEDVAPIYEEPPPQPAPRRAERAAPLVRRDPLEAQESAPPRSAPPHAPPRAAAPPLRRPLRGPASRPPDASSPELEDPLLPFFDDDALAPSVDSISEPLDARIRRMKDQGHPPGPPEEYIPARARRSVHVQEETVPAPRVGPLTGVLPDADEDGWLDEVEREDVYPPEPRRQGPPEQYLPPHLRSEPRMTATPAHPPQPVLSREDVNRLQAALYELGECRRLLANTQTDEK